MEYPKTGYLNEDLRLFHLTDAGRQEFRYHYHDFHKLLLPLSGNVSYLIEGKHYHLEPGDAVLVLDSTIKDADNTVLEYKKGYYRTDKYAFTLMRSL